MRPTKVYTLVLLHKGNKVLLGLKKRGFGVGKWNGFGGKVEKTDKSIKDGAIREVHEECHIICNNLEYIAKITFEFEPGSTKEDLPLMEVHVFKGEEKDFVGEPEETDEMCPRWFDQEKMPYSEMWPDDRYWWPVYLQGHKFIAYFKYSGFDNIIQHTIDTTHTLSD